MLAYKMNLNLNPKTITYLIVILYVTTTLVTLSLNYGIDGEYTVDTITTPGASNCGCDYPSCGCVQITLIPTVYLTPLPTFINPATPDIPDPTANPTIFPTFEIDGLLPTPISTVEPNSQPTPPTVPTIAPFPF